EQPLPRDHAPLLRPQAQVPEPVAWLGVGHLEVAQGAHRVPSDRLELEPAAPRERATARLTQNEILLHGEIPQRLIARMRRAHEAHPRFDPLATIGCGQLFPEELDRSTVRGAMAEQ